MPFSSIIHLLSVIRCKSAFYLSKIRYKYMQIFDTIKQL